MKYKKKEISPLERVVVDIVVDVVIEEALKKRKVELLKKDIELTLVNNDVNLFMELTNELKMLG